MSDVSVDAVKLETGLWVWIVQPPSGAFYQSGRQFKRRADAIKDGASFAEKFSS